MQEPGGVLDKQNMDKQRGRGGKKELEMFSCQWAVNNEFTDRYVDWRCSSEYCCAGLYIKSYIKSTAEEGQEEVEDKDDEEESVIILFLYK